MIQQLRTLAALSEDPHSIPSTSTASEFQFQGNSMPPFWPLWAPEIQMVHRHKNPGKNAHTCEVKLSAGINGVHG